MHAQSTPTLEAEAPGFSEYLGILRKRRSLLFKIGLPIVAIASLLAIGLPDVYRSSGLIEIEEDRSSGPVRPRSEAREPAAVGVRRDQGTGVFHRRGKRKGLAPGPGAQVQDSGFTEGHAGQSDELAPLILDLYQSVFDGRVIVEPTVDRQADSPRA